MKRQTPKKRKQSGIIFIILAVVNIIGWTTLSVSTNSFDRFVIIHITLSIVWFFQGVYYIVTLKEYTERYFPIHNFACPQSADGLPLDDNSDQLQKEILKEAQKYTIEDFNSLKLRMILATAALGVIFFVTPDYSIWMFVIVLPIFAITLWANWLRLKPDGEILVGKLLFVLSIILLLLSPAVFLLVYFLTRIIVSSVIISISLIILSAVLYLTYVKNFKHNN